MDFTAYAPISATNQWNAILPEIYLGCLAIILLFADLLRPESRKLTARLAFWGQALLLAVLLWRWWAVPAAGGEPRIVFAGMLAQTRLGDLMRIFFVGVSLVVSHLGAIHLERRPLAKVEFQHILLVLTAGFMLLVQSNHFIGFFVVLETITIGFYILTAYARNSSASLEAGLKYLVTGALSSAILLFGIVLLYGAAGNPLLPLAAADPLHFGELGAFIGGADATQRNAGNLLVLSGAALVLCGVAFKIGVVPFQIWIPDVYQGAPTPVTALLAVSSKAAGFIVLYLLLSGPFAALQEVLVPLLAMVAGLTMIFGNIAALGQRNVKRLLGMSGVAHAGILLLGMLAALSVPWGFSAVLFYLFVYAAGSLAVFAVMTQLAPAEDADQDLDLSDGLLRRQPFLGGVLLVGIGSLAGIPPLAGFIAKLLIFIAAFQAGLYWLLALALGGVVVSIYYYFSWIRVAVTENPFIEEKDRAPVVATGLDARIVLAVLTAITLSLGLYQGWLGL
jgi:NADH-quinone oxidoreductase subunit N